ncbi:hypothetical protein ACFWYW_51195 [Nonomuraea sp. NPDC059023]|uniref:hypothetical protein n=1 Tax=unclassified Nonomuraea TaxID=2593643 RepID=UPI00369F022D
MMSGTSNRPYLMALCIFLFAVLGILFLPRLVYGAILESQVEGHAEDVLEKYAEHVGRQLHTNPRGQSWRAVKGARVLRDSRPNPGSLVISTSVTVPAGAIFFSSSGYEVRCYDVSFTGIGAPDQRYTLDKISGCAEELRGPAIHGSR